MKTKEETHEDPEADSLDEAPRVGLAVVFENGPTWRAVPVGNKPLIIGRSAPGLVVNDELASREHVAVQFSRGEWSVTEMGSRNGTFLDGQRLEQTVRGPWRCLRVGKTLMIPVADLRAHGPVQLEADRVLGLGLKRALERIRLVAQSSRTLLILGESGTGKEFACEVFHQAVRPSGPLRAVNCAAIPSTMAERLFFGAKKGAYSDARENAPGYFQSAHRGVLFLDELGELDLAVQAKLLRVLESGEVLPLGAVETEKVDVVICGATNRPLDEAVAAGRFRSDLYYRLAQAQVQLPPLRTRAEEVPVLIAHELRTANLTAAPRFIEACLLRAWPGNVRELLAEVRAAVAEARLEQSGEVRASHLRPEAGVAKLPPASKPAVTASEVTREQVEAMLAAHGTVAGAARALGLHRTQLYRLLDTFGLKPS